MTNEEQNFNITPEQYPLLKKVSSIFMPYAALQIQEVFKDQSHARMVHYTSAESALNIIKSKRFWMRNTNCMSDYREVQHGRDIFDNYFADISKKEAFVKALDMCAPGAAHEAAAIFDKSWRDIRYSTYIAALSVHDKKEELCGRLSMWRAFGGNSPRVGIVLNIPIFSLAPLALGIMFSPVAYLSQESAHKVLLGVVENVQAECAFLKTLDRKLIVGTVFAMFLTGIVCLKHESFHEEREWRAIYIPKFRASQLMEFSTKAIEGIPQIIYQLPLDAGISGSIADLDFSRIFDSLIIGPTEYPEPVCEAFIAELIGAGVPDAEQRVIRSNVSLRSR